LTAPSGAAADSANSNFVINETDTFTNRTDAPLTLGLDRFRFHASRVTDPVTPFVVRVNGDNDFTVLAIGSTRTSYAAGNNDLPFSDGPQQLTLAPGEKIAPGFMDAYPDGTGGTANGAVSYTEAGDEIFYSYDVTDTGSGISPGNAPEPRGYPLTDQHRDYYFSISLGFGGQEDEDGDGLPDRWELAYAPGTAELS